jgi:hypothetical protein
MLNSGNKSLCLLCLFILLRTCFYLEHISRVWCRSTLCWGSCRIWVDKQACFVSVHNLFSQIYFWASLISVDLISPWQAGISGHFPGFSGFPGVSGKIFGVSGPASDSCEKVCDFQVRLFTPPPSSRHLGPFNLESARWCPTGRAKKCADAKSAPRTKHTASRTKLA